MLRSLIITAAIGAVSFGLAPAASAQPRPAGPAGGPWHSFDPIPASPASQRNAVAKAQDYLSFSSFSRKGLIQQLMYDGFSQGDATYAVDSITVDWNEQAALKATDYLSFSSFSEQGLVQQLVYDGFTPSQAAYGVAVAYQ